MMSADQATDALEAERAHASQLTDKALSAIDAVVALSSHTLTALAIIIGLIGLIGIFGAIAIFSASRQMAKKVAIARIDAYIKGEEGYELIKKAIKDEVQMQFESKIVVMVQPQPSGLQAGPSFPSPPNREE